MLPTALPALLAALTAACQQGGDAALANRLKALLTALTKAKAEPANINPTGAVAIPEGEAMAALLRRTLYLASRHKDKKATAAAAAAFCYLLRSSITEEGRSPVLNDSQLVALCWLPNRAWFCRSGKGSVNPWGYASRWLCFENQAANFYICDHCVKICSCVTVVFTLQCTTYPLAILCFAVYFLF